MHIGQEELVLCAGDGHVAQAALLLQAVLVRKRARSGEEPVLQAQDEHGLELQPLGAVHGHQRHGAAVFRKAVHVRDQRRLLEVVLQGGGLGRALVFADGAQELLDVLHALLGLVVDLVVLGEDPGRVQGVVHVLGDAHRLLAGEQIAHQVRKLLHRGARAGAEAGDLLGLHGRAEHGFARVLRAPGQGLHRRVADAAARLVDDAAQGDVVVGVDGKAQVGQNVLDLLAVVEALAAVDAVGHAGEDQVLFRHAALRVCAVQDGHLLVLHALGVQAQDLPADKAGLALLVRQGRDQDRLARAPLGPKALALSARVVGDDGVGRLEDAVGGAVVLLELYRVAVLVVLFKVEDVADVRAAPAVDGLVVVAHDAQVVLPLWSGRG